MIGIGPRTFQQALFQTAQNYASAKALRGPIPIIFHIVYNSPAENIAYSVIQDYVDKSCALQK